jgi:hypothetical protein
MKSFFLITCLFFSPVFLHGLGEAGHAMDAGHGRCLNERERQVSGEQLLTALSGKRLMPLLQDFKRKDVDAAIQALKSQQHPAHKAFVEFVRSNKRNKGQKKQNLERGELRESLEQECVVALYGEIAAAERRHGKRRGDNSCYVYFGVTGLITSVAGICLTVWFATAPC